MKYLFACCVVGFVFSLAVCFVLICVVGMVHLVLTGKDGGGMAGFTLFMGIVGACVVGWEWATKTINSRNATLAALPVAPTTDKKP